MSKVPLELAIVSKAETRSVPSIQSSKTLAQDPENSLTRSTGSLS